VDGDWRKPSTPRPGIRGNPPRRCRGSDADLQAGALTTSAAPVLAVVAARRRKTPGTARRCSTPGSARRLPAGRRHSTPAARGLPLPAAVLPAPPAVRRPLPERCKSLHGRLPGTSPERGDFLQFRLRPVNFCSITQTQPFAIKLWNRGSYAGYMLDHHHCHTCC
jgi:hypothetical protein